MTNIRVTSPRKHASSGGGGSLADREARRRQRREQRLVRRAEAVAAGEKSNGSAEMAAVRTPPPHILHCRRLRAVVDRPGALRFRWEAGSGGEHGSAERWELQLKEPNAAVWTGSVVEGCREHAVSGLRGGAVYLARVRHATGGVGGPWACTSAAVPLPGANLASLLA